MLGSANRRARFHGKAKEMAELHDIHNPKREKPYVHEEFPKLVYKAAKKDQHPHDANKVVNDEDELKAALKAGFEEKPIYPEVEEVEGEEGEAVEVVKAPKAPKAPKAKKEPKSKKAEDKAPE
jgi:hypothetical protein